MPHPLRHRVAASVARLSERVLSALTGEGWTVVPDQAVGMGLRFAFGAGVLEGRRQRAAEVLNGVGLRRGVVVEGEA
jgi:hypothetical protein